MYEGKYEPVYKLARVETSERNKFQLVAQAVFTDHVYSERTNSDTFLVRTQRIENESRFILPLYKEYQPCCFRQNLISELLMIKALYLMLQVKKNTY